METVSERVTYTKPEQIEIEWPAGHVAAAFGKPDQARDYHGRWGHGGGSSSTPLSGDAAFDHVGERTKTYGYDQYDRKMALKDYADTGYGFINDGLRRVKGNASELEGKRPSQVNELDAVFHETKAIEKPISVYRGTRDYKNTFGVASGDELVGTQFTDHAFMSTSADRTVAEGFAGGRNAAVFTITAPPGTKALQVNKATGMAKRDEAEILFERSSSVKITNVTTASDGHLEIAGEIV